MIDRTGFSRLPVYHETTDDIRGVLYAKDLLKCWGEPPVAPAVHQEGDIFDVVVVVATHHIKHGSQYLLFQIPLR